MSANVEQMMYVREVPWHGLGTKLDKEATAIEALEASGLNTTVDTRPVAYMDAMNRPVVIPNKQAIVRHHDQQCYAVTSTGYVPIQNADAFSFFDALVGEGQAIYHTAGSLGNGSRIWILAKLPQSAMIRNIDQVDNYLLLVNGHDGTLSFQMLWTPIRVVCQNTMVRALDSASSQIFQMRHSTNILKRVQVAKDTLGLSNRMFTDFIDQAERIASQSFLQAELDDYLKKVFEIAPNDNMKNHPRLQAHITRINELVEVGAGLQTPEIKGSKWAVYNAVTEFVDHERGKDRDKALNSAWFGPGANLKQHAWILLLNSN